MKQSIGLSFALVYKPPLILVYKYPPTLIDQTALLGRDSGWGWVLRGGVKLEKYFYFYI